MQTVDEKKFNNIQIINTLRNCTINIQYGQVGLGLDHQLVISRQRFNASSANFSTRINKLKSAFMCR